MTVTRRVKDMARATWNERDLKEVSPAQLDQEIRTLKERCVAWYNSVQETEQHAVKLKRHVDEAKAWVQKRDEQAGLALRAGDESTARLALMDKQKQQAQAERYQELFLKASVARDEAVLGWQAASTRWREAEEQRKWLAARMETTRLQQEMAQHSGQTGWQRTFDQMEQKISSLEWDAAGWQDLRRSLGEVAKPIGIAIHRFGDELSMAKQADPLVDQELAKLKRRMAKSREEEQA